MGGRCDYGGIYLVIIAPLCSSDQNSLLSLIEYITYPSRDGPDDGSDNSNEEFSTSMNIDSAIAGQLISFEIGEMINLSSPQLLEIFVDTEEETEKLSGGSALKKTQKSQCNQLPNEQGMLEWQDFQCSYTKFLIQL